MLIRKNLIHEPSEGFVCMSPSKTQQQFKDECDVNNILRNYVSTGVLTHVSDSDPIFGDFSQLPADYGEALDLIHKSEEQFAALPSEVRDRFNNKPLDLVRFLSDNNNREEAVKLGLVVERKEEERKEEKTSD